MECSYYLDNSPSVSATAGRRTLLWWRGAGRGLAASVSRPKTGHSYQAGTLLWTAIIKHILRQKIFFHFPKNINAQLYFNSKCSDFVREGDDGLSPGQCVSACSGAGYSYAGLGGGRGCHCGHTHPRHQDRSHNQSDFYCLSLPFVALGPA